MASSGKKVKKSKGRTLPLTEFLGDVPALPPPVLRKNNWSDEVDDTPLPSMLMNLPTAPRAVRGPDFDEARIPQNGPFVAYISNLLYDVEEKDIQDFFEGLNISNIRLPRDDRNGKQKGFGYVEFGDRASFLDALQIADTSIKGRHIRIEIADSSDNNSYRRGGMGRDRDRDSNYDPERTSSDWRAGPRPELDDRRGGGRRDFGYRDSDRDRDRGSNFSDSGSNWRDAPRRPMEDRDDRDRGSEGRDRDGRSSFGGRRNFGDRDRMRNGSPPPPIGERPKLQLKPRTLPIEPIQVRDDAPAKDEEPPVAAPKPIKPSAESIFGGAKPVDTSAREREIEERLAKLDLEPKPRGELRERSIGRKDEKDTAPPPPENAWAKRSQRAEDDSASADDGESSSRPDNNEEKKESRNNDDSERAPEDTREPERESSDTRDKRETSGDREKYRPPQRDRDSYRDRPSYKDSDRSRGYRDNDRDRGSYRDGDRDRGSYRDSDRGSYRDGDRSYRSDRDRGSYRDGDRDRSYRDNDRDRGSYRDSDRDRGSYRDADRDRGSYRDSDRDRAPQRDSDRDRGYNREWDRDKDRSYRDSDRDKGREPERDDRERPRDADRERERVRVPEDRSRDRDDKDKRGGSGSRSTAKGPSEKGTPREPRPPREQKALEPDAPPNYVAPNKYSFLEEGASE